MLTHSQQESEAQHLCTDLKTPTQKSGEIVTVDVSVPRVFGQNFGDLLQNLRKSTFSPLFKVLIALTERRQNHFSTMPKKARTNLIATKSCLRKHSFESEQLHIRRHWLHDRCSFEGLTPQGGHPRPPVV